MSESKVLRGKVCWFNVRQGYGFITRDDGQGDVFVHYSNIQADGFKTLKEGQAVEFQLGENHKGQQSINVKILKEV